MKCKSSINYKCAWPPWLPNYNRNPKIYITPCLEPRGYPASDHPLINQPWCFSMQMVMKTAGLHGSRLEIGSRHSVPIRVGARGSPQATSQASWSRLRSRVQRAPDSTPTRSVVRVSMVYRMHILFTIQIMLIEGSLEVKLPTIWTVEKQRWEESEVKRSEERRCRCAKR